MMWFGCVLCLASRLAEFRCSQEFELHCFCSFPSGRIIQYAFFLLLNLAVFSTSFHPFSSQGHCLCNFYGDLIIVMHLRLKDSEIKIHFLIIPSWHVLHLHRYTKKRKPNTFSSDLLTLSNSASLHLLFLDPLC